MAPLPCENTSAAWQLFFTARTWAKPHRLDSSVTLLLRRVVQSNSNVLKLLQKSSRALKTFFQLLQTKRLQLKLTNTLQNPTKYSHNIKFLGHGSNIFFLPGPLPFGGSTLLEAYSSTTSRSRPRTRGESIRG